MSLENWFIETVLADKPHIPGSALQFLLNQYMSYYSQKERLFKTRFNPGPAETGVLPCGDERVDQAYSFERLGPGVRLFQTRGRRCGTEDGRGVSENRERLERVGLDLERQF